CEILQYLHGFSLGSIIHLDLQPKNIILSNGRFKLIDFGNAICVGQNKKRKYFFGTLGYAAPEQYQGSLVDVRADIYGLGTILYYLVTKKEPNKEGNQILNLEEINYISPHLRKIIQKCLSYNPSQRYSAVSEVVKQLKSLRREVKPSNKQKKSSLNISIAGTQSRIGVTHISLALASFLSESNYQALYKEENHSRAISQLKKHCTKLKEKEGTYYYNSLKIRPNYKGIVKNQGEDYPFVINDFGFLNEENVEEFKKGNIHFLVGGIKGWEIDKIKDAQKLLYSIEEIESLIYLINFTEEKQFFHFMKKESIKAYRVPYFTNPLEMDKGARGFFEGVCREILVKDLKKSWKVRRK
ncbi:MAG: protein kinase, partial [Clostridiales bacterium]|nr:protein kinase [Clostridiales bacterium]